MKRNGGPHLHILYLTMFYRAILIFQFNVQKGNVLKRALFENFSLKLRMDRTEEVDCCKTTDR